MKASSSVFRSKMAMLWKEKESEGKYGVERSWAFMVGGPWRVTQQRGSIAGLWHIVPTDGMNNAPPAVIDSE